MPDDAPGSIGDADAESLRMMDAVAAEFRLLESGTDPAPSTDNGNEETFGNPGPAAASAVPSIAPPQHAIPVVAGQAIFHDPFATAEERAFAAAAAPTFAPATAPPSADPVAMPIHAPKIDFAALKRARSATLDSAKGAVNRMFGAEEGAAVPPPVGDRGDGLMAPESSGPAPAPPTAPMPSGEPYRRAHRLAEAIDDLSKDLAASHPILLQAMGWTGALLAFNALMIVTLAALGWI